MPVLQEGRAQDCFALDKTGVYRCLAWRDFGWLRHGFGTRHAQPIEGAMTLRQVHSNRVRRAEEVTDADREGDALVTDRTGVPVAVRTADCVPILLLDRQTRAVAAIHAGWRGTAGAIVQATVARLVADLGARPVDLSAAIGPCIQGCCYQVGPEVAAQFPDAEPPDTAGRSYLDLAASNRRLLADAGVPVSRIFDCGLCTRCVADTFYSYRRDAADPGRMLSAIERIA